jgi:ribosome modulation factor
MRRLNNRYWEQGYDAYLDGKKRENNPFDPDRDENLYELWQEGWDCADTDSDDE